MIRTNHDCPTQETLQKYATAIRHFRGYLDKEKFNDDLRFLLNFVREVSGESESTEYGRPRSKQTVG